MAMSNIPIYCMADILHKQLVVRDYEFTLTSKTHLSKLQCGAVLPISWRSIVGLQGYKTAACVIHVAGSLAMLLVTDSKMTARVYLYDAQLVPLGDPAPSDASIKELEDAVECVAVESFTRVLNKGVEWSVL
jgi:hypothetical protein